MRKKSSSGKKKSPTNAKRLEQLEELVVLLLQASLRGRLLPSERKPIKEFLRSRKQKRQAKAEKSSPIRCPACRSPLTSQRVKRCPWCSVLLSQAGGKRRSKR